MNLNPFKRITRTYARIQRYRDIARVMFRHGFGDVVTRLGLHRYLPFRQRKHERAYLREELSRYERIRIAFEELGPTFIKLGQLLSTRRDVVPEALAMELEKLQDEIPPFPTAEVQRIIEEEFGRPAGQVFRSLNTTALASASIAQVHEAWTREGDRVAVKIRRPKIREQVETDLEIMDHLASLAERMIEGADVFDLHRIVAQFARMIRKEMDFALEAANIKRFQNYFGADRRLYVLNVYPELSTPRILTMEYVTGVKITDLSKYPQHNLDPRTVAERGAELALEQVLTYGFFHADPHPGNILVRPGNVLCMLDYGTMGSLSDRLREQMSKLIIGFVEHDERRVTTAVYEIAGASSYANIEELEGEIANFIDDNLYKPLGDIQIGEVLSSLSQLLVRYRIHMPAPFFLMAKCFTTIEAIGRHLAPDFDLLQYLEPFAKRLVRERISIKKTAHDLYLTAADIRMMVRDAPREIRQIFGLFKNGELGFKFEHRGLDTLKHTLDQVSNRVTYGIVLAALIIGSSVMVLSDIPPKWHEIPLLGVAGFMMSGVMGFKLLHSMHKHGKM